MTSHDAIRGVLPVVQTPFFESGTIDFETLEREIHWIFDQGADGVVVGMVSEFLRLSDDERDAQAEVVVRTAQSRGRSSVIGVAAESSYTAARHTRFAAEIGATGVMASPPLATILDESELLRYYEALLAASSLPVIVQDASGYIGRPIGVAVQARIFTTFGPRVMFKPEAQPIGPNLSELRDATSGEARVFEGTGGISLIDSFRRGIAGTMPGADVCWAIVRLWEALSAGDFDLAYKIHGPLASLISMQPSLDCFLAVQKYLLVKQSVFANDLRRGPLSFHMDDETRAEVDHLFETLRDVCELSVTRLES